MPISKSNCPVIGITADIQDNKYAIMRSYANMVVQAGGAPVILTCNIQCLPEYVGCCDGFVLSGGDDVITTRWGVPIHPKAKPMHPDRQAFELALLDALNARSESRKPVFGVCLGMQLMGMHAGGKIDQHLADSLPTAEDHWNKRAHEVQGELGCGIVHSHHRQALTQTGSMRAIASAPDGVIEAIKRDDHPFYVGVQWHPERTEDDELGLDLFRQLVAAARRTQ